MIHNFSGKPKGLPYSQQVYDEFAPDLQWSQNFMLGTVLAGELKIQYENHTRSFTEHDIFFFLPFETFSVLSARRDTKVLFLCVDADFMNTIMPELAHLSLQKHYISHDLNNKVYYQVCCDIATILFKNKKSDPCSRLKLLDALANILITVFENYGARSEGAKKYDYATERMIDILNYINENYTEKITVNDISSYLGIHPQYFSAFFTKHFHTGFVEYLTSFRVNASLGKLINSKDNILNIALCNGFSNHKTYAAAFRKVYHMSPTDYRKKHAALTEENKHHPAESEQESEYSIFSYFCQFLLPDNQDGGQHALRQSRTLELDPQELLPHSCVKRHKHYYAIGRAAACLRTDMQNQISQAKSDLSIDYLRIRDIFSDSLYVYYESEDNDAIFNWQALDHVFDFILSLGAKPFPEIGYMPEKLASKKQYAHLPYHPNISCPKSLKKWQELIRSFLLHYIDRYGRDEVAEWYFDFWTSPDLTLKMSYWNESMECFFDFYRATYEVFQEIAPDFLLGSPNFSTISGYPWYEAFFLYCKKHRIDPAYISIHAYGCDTHTSTPPSGDFTNTDNRVFTITNQNQVSDFLTKLHRIMDKNGFGAKEVIVSDFNLNYMPFDLIRDTCYMGPYLAHSILQTRNQVKALCYWSLSDISEDSYPMGNLFWGGPGLLDYHGLKKASYNTLVLLNRLGRQILDQGENYIFIKKENTYQLFLYHLVEFDYFYSHMDQSAINKTHRYNIYSNNDDLYMNIILHLPRGTYTLKRFEVNRNHGSAYDIWGQMGYPQTFTEDMEDYLRKKSVPYISYFIENVEDTLILNETIPAHGVMLLEIQPKESA